MDRYAHITVRYYTIVTTTFLWLWWYSVNWNSRVVIWWSMVVVWWLFKSYLWVTPKQLMPLTGASCHIHYLSCSDSRLQGSVYTAAWDYSHGGGQLYGDCVYDTTIRINRSGEDPNFVCSHPAESPGGDTLGSGWVVYDVCMTVCMGRFLTDQCIFCSIFYSVWQIKTLQTLHKTCGVRQA